jgi:hypothetical protein
LLLARAYIHVPGQPSEKAEEKGSDRIQFVLGWTELFICSSKEKVEFNPSNKRLPICFCKINNKLPI